MPVNVAFIAGRVMLNEDFLPTLALIVNTLKKFPSTSIAIDGHTDSVGTLESNLLISQERANVIMNNLVKKGISANRFVSVQGLAYKYPIDTNDNKIGRQNNQRVEIKIFPSKKKLKYKFLVFMERNIDFFYKF
ncbi:OmpA family protein [Candidatus Liberibacter brunswickensis]|uniref:OmpA family protein n=1 Tax=Candidatus Liberibacter brunswickensis TaxID=1968796 RepID=UPI002FE34B33